MSDNNIDVEKLRMCAEHYPKLESDKLQSLQQSSNSPAHFQKLKAAFVNSKIWPINSLIKIAFYPRKQSIELSKYKKIMNLSEGVMIDPLQIKIEENNLSVEDAIKLVVEERIKPLCKLNFKFVSMDEKPNVRISFDPKGGAWSFIGTDHLKEKNGPTMNFGWYDAQTIIHEFGHLLGMIHEHQNPFGKPIEWNLPLLYKWASTTQKWSKEVTDNNIVNHYDQTLINGSDFDPLSIMLYFFPPVITLDKKGTKLNTRLSGYDVKWISNIYKVDEKDADEFYKKIYGISLKEAMELSMSKSTSTSNEKNSTTTGSMGPTMSPNIIDNISKINEKVDIFSIMKLIFILVIIILIVKFFFF